MAAAAYICIGLADGNEPYSSAACTQYKHTHRHTRAYKLYTRAGENERWRIYIYIYARGACAKGTKNAEVLDTPGVVRCADERERWLGGWCELWVSGEDGGGGAVGGIPGDPVRVGTKTE